MRHIALLLFMAFVSACSLPEPTPTPTSEGKMSVVEELLATLFPPPTPTLTPTPVPTPTATPSPTPTPTPELTQTSSPSHTPTPTLTPDEEDARAYAIGYAAWKQCGDIWTVDTSALEQQYGPTVRGGLWGAEIAFCEPSLPPTPTAIPRPTPTPLPSLTAPRAVWGCFLDRNDELSPCGWRVDDGKVYKWQSNIDLYLEHPEAAELTPQFIDHAKVLGDVLEEVQVLLRIDAFVCPVECFSTARPEGAPGLNVSFVDAEKVHCKGHEGEYTGCAGQWDGYQHEGKWYLNTANVWVATEGLSSRQLRHVLMHELLHALTLIGHAEHGIMALAASARSEALTAMDTAQMWLYSNPLIQSGMSLDELKLMVRYGAWDEPPPEFVDAVQRCLNQLQYNEDYILAHPRTRAYLEYLCREEGRLGI